MNSEMETILFEEAKRWKQSHIFQFLEELSATSRGKLFNQIKTIDFSLMADLAARHIFQPERRPLQAFDPMPVVLNPRSREDLAINRRAKEVGEQVLIEGKVAVVLVAGGQGTRLGFEGPKGFYEMGPVSRKSLFQLHAEKIKAVSKKYHTTIPWFIMTSELNDQQTRKFFQDKNFFELDSGHVFFFKQGMIPALDISGKLILDAKDHIFENPNGHGGTLFSLKDSLCLGEMKKRGIEYIFYFQVDNVLINICDPYFLGYHSLSSSEMSAKVVKKRNANEKVGVIVKQNGKTTVIEYSDMTDADKQALNPNGELKFNSGSIAIHVLNRQFVEKIVAHHSGLPYHVAHKKINYLDSDGNKIVPASLNGYKFEMFIFDALPFAENPLIMEVDRLSEFSPIKNESGEDSPETAQKDLINYYGRMLEKAGVMVPHDEQGNFAGAVEISPLYALDDDELRIKISSNFKFKNNLYLTP